MIKFYIDGCCKGNPGEAGCGFCCTTDGVHFYGEHKYLGVQTNNTAEFKGAIEALKFALKIGYSDIIVHTDSKLVANCLNGKWKARERHLIDLDTQAKQLMTKISNVKFKFIPREFNRKADELANRAVEERRK